MIGKANEVIKWLVDQDQEKTYEVKVYHPSKTLNQNGYCWELIVQMANILKTNKNQVYEMMLERYSQSQIISIRADIDISHFFKHYIQVGSGIVKDKIFNHYKVMKGISELDTKEMSILIDGVVSEAKEMGIETLTEEEIRRTK